MVQQAHIDDPAEVWSVPGYEATTVPSTLYGNSVNQEGHEGEYDNIDPSTGLNRDNTTKLMRRVRYAGAATLTAGDVLKYTTGYRRKRVDKASQAPDATHPGHFDGVVNEHISGSIYPGQIFWMTIKGVDKADIYEANAVAIGDRLVVNGSGTLGLAAISTADAAGTNQAIAGERCIAEATKDATGGAATTVATLVSLNCDPYVVD